MRRDRSEVSDLGWDSVDLVSGEIRIYDTKSGDDRLIGIDGDLAPIMDRRAAARRVSLRDGTTYLAAHVFHRKGKRVAGFRRAWGDACHKAGLPGLLFHDLRRSGIRNLRRAGVPESVAMSLSGHKTRATFDRYSISNTEDQRDAIRAVSDYAKQRAEAGKVVRMKAKA